MDILKAFPRIGTLAARSHCCAEAVDLEKRQSKSPRSILRHVLRSHRRLTGTVVPRKLNCFAARGGFSLAEVVISTFLIGTLAVSSLYTSLAITRSYQSLNDQSRSSLLAQRYLTEILQAFYEDPVSPVFGPEPNEMTSTRSDFNDVDDYQGRSESPPTSKDGAPLSGYEEGWTVSITVTLVSLANPRNSSPEDTGLKRVEVVVTNPNGESFRMSGLRSRWGGKDQVPFDEGNSVHWVGLNLGSRASQFELQGGTEPLNVAEVVE